MNNPTKSFNVRVVFEPRQIRHITVQCPFCNKWFWGSDVTDHNLSYESDIEFAEFKCPLCEKQFSAYPIINEVGYPEVYENCLTKNVQTVWEESPDSLLP